MKPALAAEYTDLWVTAGEDAWGVNFVQWGSIIYATFYIYGPDNKPIWYSAVLNCDGLGKFTGTLYLHARHVFRAAVESDRHVDEPGGRHGVVPAVDRPTTIRAR